MKLGTLCITQLMLLAAASSVLFGNVLEPYAYSALGFHIVMSSLLVFSILYALCSLAFLGFLFLRRRWQVEDLFHLLVAGGHFLVGIVLFLGTDPVTRLAATLVAFLMTFVSYVLELSRKRVKRNMS